MSVLNMSLSLERASAFVSRTRDDAQQKTVRSHFFEVARTCFPHPNQSWMEYTYDTFSSTSWCQSLKCTLINTDIHRIVPGSVQTNLLTYEYLKHTVRIRRILQLSNIFQCYIQWEIERNQRLKGTNDLVKAPCLRIENKSIHFGFKHDAIHRSYNVIGCGIVSCHAWLSWHIESSYYCCYSGKA